MQEEEYLVQWSQYPVWMASWEPVSNLTPTLRQSYMHPIISSEDNATAIADFLAAITRKLKGRSRSDIAVACRLDIFRLVKIVQGNTGKTLEMSCLVTRDITHQIFTSP